MTSLLKISGGFDFTPYIAKKGFEIAEDVPKEKSGKDTADGFYSRVLATYGITTIKVTFTVGNDVAAASAILTALDVGNTALFEYWSPLKNKYRKALFMVAVEPINVLSTDGCIKYGTWSATLTQAGVSSDVASITVSAFPTVVTTAGSWSNPSNVKLNDGLYATTGGALNDDTRIRASGYGFAIPAGVVINYVNVEVEYHLSTVASAADISLYAAYNGSKRGNSLLLQEPTTDLIALNTQCGVWTIDDINNTLAMAVVNIKRTSSVACTYYLDYLKMYVNYSVI